MGVREYLILEYQTCQQKISSAVEHLIRIELYALIGISAFYGWFYGMISNDAPPAESIRIAFYLPPILASLAWYRASMQLKYIAAIAEYLKLVEARLSSESVSERTWSHVGWESWYVENGPRTWNTTYRALLWPGLFIGTLVVALLGIGIS